MKRLIFPVLLLLIAGCSRPGVQVTGTIMGADGQPPALAHVHVTPLGDGIRNPQKTVQAGEDGSFAVRLDQPGAYYLQITAAGHDIAVLPVVLEEQESPVEVSVTLAPLSYKDTFDEVSVIGDWNRYSRETAEPMARQADGTFLYERETTAETLTYQLLHITTTSRNVNGTLSDAFEYDGGGDYRSVIKVWKGVARIMFDPELLLRSDDPALPKVVFDEEHAHMTRLAEIRRDIRRDMQEYEEARTAYYKEHKDLAGFQFDLSPLSSRLRAVMDSEESLLVRQYAAVRLGGNLQLIWALDSATYVDIMQLVQPSSLLWGLKPLLPYMLAEQINPDHLDSLVRVFVDENPDRRVQAVSLFKLMGWAESQKNQEEANRLYAQLKKGYSDIGIVKTYLNLYNPDSRIKAGKPVPEFEVQLMGLDEVVSSESLTGRTYLMDFWHSI